MKRAELLVSLCAVLAFGSFLLGANGAIVINEIMYNPDSAQGTDDDYEWIELHNTGAAAVNVGGWKLRDDNPQNDPFVIPSNSFIQGGDYLVLCSNVGFIYFTYHITNAVGNFGDEFGFGNDGDTVTLLNATNQVIDQVRYNDAYPWPFEADGDGPSLERVNPLEETTDPHNWAASVPASERGTPGRKNSLFSDGSAPPIIINEIHYRPVSGGDDYEYVELYNASAGSVSVTNWEFTNGISFKFLQPTTMGPFSHIVVCKNKERIRTDYGIENVVGDFAEGSSLNNAGETVVLRDNTGRLVDFVAYSDERYWPIASDGYGPSIECISAGRPNSDPANWAASAFTRRWVHVETSPAAPTGEFLYFYLDGSGEALLDDVSLVPEGGGQNLIPNGDFETSDAGWVAYGNHGTSGRVTSEAYSGTACMKIVSTGDGGGGEWRNYVGVPLEGLSGGQNYVLSFWAKPLSGETRFIARVANSRSTEGICAVTDLSGKGFVSTPGDTNSVIAENLAPFIFRVRHSPAIPNPRIPVWVTARVVDDGTLSSVSVEYDAGQGWCGAMPMFDDGKHSDGVAGDGDFGAELPAQPSYTIVHYRVLAEDDQGAVGVSPDADDMKSSYAYFCYDNEVKTTLPIYFLFVSDENLQRLEELGSRDDYVPGTFVCGGIVYENVGVRWYGTFSERIETEKKSWRIKFNPWERLELANFSYRLDSLILLGGDYLDQELRGSTGLRESLTQQVFKFASCAYSDTKHIHLQLNGSHYGLMLQVERPDTDYLERNLRDVEGDLFQADSLPGQPPSNMSVLPYYDDYAFAYDRKTNRAQPHDGLVSFIEDLQNTPEDEIEGLFIDSVNEDKYTRYLAAVAMAQDWVSSSRDYYLFFGKYGTTGNERYLWEVMPWGGEHNWERPSLPVLNGITGQNEYSLPNILRTRFLNNPQLRQLFADRLRQLLDTTFTEQHLFSVIDLTKSRIQSWAELDRQFWWPEANSLASHAAALKSDIAARREFLYRWLDQVSGPAQPLNVSPADGSQYVSVPVTLIGSDFSGLPGTAHGASQWQIRSEIGLYSAPVWDSGEDSSNKTSIVVSLDILSADARYFWHVSYKDDQGQWSLWSDETSFSTYLDAELPTILSAFCMPNAVNEILVVFSEPVDAASAEELSNYVLNDSVSPDGASLSPDGLTVTLTVPSGVQTSSLSVSNVADVANPPNVIAPDTKVSIQVYASETKINFQPDSEPTPSGYVKDTGAEFDSGQGYGWTTDITDLAQVRDIQSDERLDTLLQFGGEGSAWEFALPSAGKCRVTAVIGDPASESVYDLSFEGVWAASGLYLPANTFRELTVEVDVADGRLTLYGGDVYRSTRIAYIHVLSSGIPFKVSGVAQSSSDARWLDITWSYVPDKSYKIHWTSDLLSWNVVVPNPADMVIDQQAGTVRWTDKGTSPGMGGVPPGQARKRFYKVEQLSQ